ncbi:FCD domain-containing protein [Ruegeria sp. R14_0]|uniref:FCD domain-containing protein n=1 Tax=Ruegeria sp. R14_0 TaxID=2821100 RepID=UPI001ADC9A71|nr:FCD domain-containing protein [Ruegeria sp. R14_0]MBO9447469.1 FCD domain-containing protein [Ruegeria sp. R14_0]
MRSSTSTNSATQAISQRKANTITSIAVDAIEEMIVSGELVAGDRINESTLAERLGISRGPIREACRSLEQAGLLTSKVNRGMYVREVSLDEARDLYELRGAIAGLAGELIVKRADDAEIAKLSGLVDQMQTAADKGDTADYYKLNLQFHDALVIAARNSSLEDTYRKIVNQLHLLRRRGLVQEGNLQVSNAEHKKIVAALTQRDASAANNALREHVSNGLTRLIASL